MRTRSACAAILLALTAGTALTLVACSPDATAPVADEESMQVATERKVQELRDRYDWIGKYHTDGLGFVYSKLKENSGKTKQRELVCRIAAKAIKEFHRAARQREVPLAFVDPSLASETCGQSESFGRIGKNVLVGNPQISANALSPVAVAYMDQIANAIYSATTRLGLLNALRSIEYSAVVNLPEAEAGAVTATVSVAINSMDYWEQNLDAWISLPGAIAFHYDRLAGTVMTTPPSSPRMTGSSKWWNHPVVRGYLKIVGADAIGGARVLYTTWSAGPIGWDAAAAAALWSSVTMTGSLLF